MVVEVPKNNEKRICEINLLHIETLECILIVIFKSHDIGQPLSGWCGLSMAGANCRWQIRIADGRFALPMAGLNYRWVVRVWSLGSVGLVTGWLLALLVVVGSLGGVGPVAGSSLSLLVVVGSSFGATHPWVVLSALGMVVVVVPL